MSLASLVNLHHDARSPHSDKKKAVHRIRYWKPYNDALVVALKQHQMVVAQIREAWPEVKVTVRRQRLLPRPDHGLVQW